MATTFPGAAENVSLAMVASGATLWRSALTVVERIRGRSKEVRDLASRERTKIRRAEMAASGETRS